MDNNTLRVEVHNSQAPTVQGVLIDSSSSISILQNGAAPTFEVGGYSISAFQSGSEMFLGNHALISTQCISDVSLISQSPDFLVSGQALLVEGSAHLMAATALPDSHGGHNVLDLSQQLVDSLPKINSGLHGNLSSTELSGLIQDLQAHLLSLASSTQDLYGEMGVDIEFASQALDSSLGLEDLFASIQADLAAVADVYSSPVEMSHAAQTTLDALFTAPESFPLTLDFSDSQHVETASELFSSLASHTTSGISSSAADDASSAGNFGVDSDKV
ncbi:MAG: hypothetical protein QE278_04450 [Limnobacter sp.]|nr:hypothetical protein [Limnobacter sp.]